MPLFEDNNTPLHCVIVKSQNHLDTNIMFFPCLSQVTIMGDEDSSECLSESRLIGHQFCTVCGVRVYMKICWPARIGLDS